MGYGQTRRAGRTISVSGETCYDEQVRIADLSDKDLLACVEEARERGLVVSGVARTALLDIQHDLICRRHAQGKAAFTSARRDDPLQEISEALDADKIDLAIVLLDKVTHPSPARDAVVIPIEWRRPPPPEPPLDHDFDALLDPETVNGAYVA